MSSPSKIHITPQDTGLLKATQTGEAAEKASFLLQEDLEKHHVFFNKDGYHNHIPHHILALYGTGAPSSSLQLAYDYNKGYQRPLVRSHQNQNGTPSPGEPQAGSGFFQSWDHARSFLGKEDNYLDYLRFFQDEIVKSQSKTGGDSKDWEEEILMRYIFNSPHPPPPGIGIGIGGRDGDGDDDGDGFMLVRMFAGLLHPLIQLMYGLEFNQPAIVVEGLAQAAVHGEIGRLEVYLLESEKRAAAAASPSQSVEREGKAPSIIDLLDEIRKNPSLGGAARRPRNAGQMFDGVLGNKEAKEELMQIASRVRVRPDEKEVERRTVEMFNTSLYVAASGARKEGKMPKFDFGLIHHVNSSPIFPTLNSEPWLPLETKARILEWKIRMDLLQYVIRGCPALGVDKIAGYKPRDSTTSADTDPKGIISRLHNFVDDGHAIKLGRAALICREMTISFLNKETSKLPAQDDSTKEDIELPIDTEVLWDKVFRLIVDSVEAPGPTWVRNCGLEESWKDVPDAR